MRASHYVVALRHVAEALEAVPPRSGDLDEPHRLCVTHPTFQHVFFDRAVDELAKPSTSLGLLRRALHLLARVYGSASVGYVRCALVVDPRRE